MCECVCVCVGSACIADEGGGEAESSGRFCWRPLLLRFMMWCSTVVDALTAVLSDTHAPQRPPSWLLNKRLQMQHPWRQKVALLVR